MPKDKIDFLRLEKLCDNRRKRSIIPWNFYHKKIGYIRNIIEISTKKIKNKRILEEVYKQQVVSLVTAMEVYLREVLVFIIDEKKIKSDNVLDSIKKSITLLEVVQVHEMLEKKGWDKAELLANEYNFQNLKNIKKAFSDLLKKDVFAGLKEYSIEGNDGKTLRLKKDFDRRIRDILELRHSLVHDINFRKKVSYNRLIEIYNQLHFFVDMLDYYLVDLVK